jgi:hypothetical protein
MRLADRQNGGAVGVGAGLEGVANRGHGRGGRPCARHFLRYSFVMIQIDAKPEERTADMTLPGGCAVCDGDLVIRVAPGSARGFCASCHALSRPQVRLVEGQLQIAYPMEGQA